MNTSTIRTSLKVGRSEGQLPALEVICACSITFVIAKYRPQQKRIPVWLRFVKNTSIPSVICQYASYVPLHSPSFPSPLCRSRHVSVVPVTSPSPSSLCFTYRSLSSSIVSPSFVFCLFLRYGSIPPLLCSEHHFSDLWLRYHTLTSSHSCGWTISLLSS